MIKLLNDYIPIRVKAPEEADTSPFPAVALADSGAILRGDRLLPLPDSVITLRGRQFVHLSRLIAVERQDAD